MPSAGARMHSIQSEDGTPIRYFRRGHGPAILLIHGTAADHSRWAPILPALQRHFTVYAMDRRGRGGSGDAARYRMDDEFADVRRLIADGDREGALAYFYGRIAQIPPRALTAMRALPDWTKQVRAVHTVLRELDAMARYELRPERFRTWNIPTLLLLGGESPPVYRAGIERMQTMLPGSTIAVLEGQGHTAMKTAPKLFVREILEFLQEEK